MEISFCTIGFQKDKWGKNRVLEKPLSEILPLLGELRYDGVEIWYPHYGELSADGRARVRQLLAEHRLTVSMISSYYDFTGSDEKAMESLTHGRAVLKDAKELGAKALRMFTGKVGSAQATEEHWTRAIHALRTLADEAAPAGIDLAFECHSWNLMDTIPSCQMLIKRLERKNVGLILQPSTFKENYLAACEALAPLSIHVHATNGAEKPTGLADGTMDYKQIVAILRKSGFERYISVEWFGEDPEGVARREASYLRQLIANA